MQFLDIVGSGLVAESTAFLDFFFAKPSKSFVTRIWSVPTTSALRSRLVAIQLTSERRVSALGFCHDTQQFDAENACDPLSASIVNPVNPQLWELYFGYSILG
jgi:hypothetical protein